MRLERIHLSNFRCLRDQEFMLGQKPIQVFLAPNGGGKTATIDGFASFLGMIPWAIASHLAREAAPIQHDDVRTEWQEQAGRLIPHVWYPSLVEGTVEVDGKHLVWGRSLNTSTSEFNEKKGRSGDLLALYGDLPFDRPLPLVARYGTGRFLAPHPTPGKTEAPLPPQPGEILSQAIKEKPKQERWRGYDKTMTGDFPWPVIRDWWAIEAATASLKGEETTQALAAVSEAIKVVLDVASPPLFELDANDVLVQVVDKGPWAPVRLLSDGYRATLALAADLARRACILNPFTGRDAARQITGVVLIDEVDLHLHPSWQRRVLTRLHQAFPGLQFIVTTHAPQIIIGVGNTLADVFVLESSEDGVPRPEIVNYEPGRSSDDILTGRWFDLHSTIDDNTLELIRQHGLLLQEPNPSPEQQQRLAALEATLRDRLGRFVETATERLALGVTSEILKEVRERGEMDRGRIREDILRRVREKRGEG